MQQQLRIHYGDKVSITSTRNQPSIVALTSNLKEIMQEAHHHITQDKYDIESLAKAVGKYIRNEIKTAEKHTGIYPTAEEIRSVPHNLGRLTKVLSIVLNEVIKSHNSDMRIAAIGQSIMRACCPRRFLLPMQIRHGITIDNKTGNKEILELASALGFSCTPYEV